MTAPDEVRALVRVRALIDGELRRLALCAVEEGSPRSAVAMALGISRASLYPGGTAGIVTLYWRTPPPVGASSLPCTWRSALEANRWV